MLSELRSVVQASIDMIKLILKVINKFMIYRNVNMWPHEKEELDKSRHH